MSIVLNIDRGTASDEELTQCLTRIVQNTGDVNIAKHRSRGRSVGRASCRVVSSSTC